MVFSEETSCLYDLQVWIPAKQNFEMTLAENETRKYYIVEALQPSHALSEPS